MKSAGKIQAKQKKRKKVLTLLSVALGLNSAFSFAVLPLSLVFLTENPASARGGLEGGPDGGPGGPGGGPNGGPSGPGSGSGGSGGPGGMHGFGFDRHGSDRSSTQQPEAVPEPSPTITTDMPAPPPSETIDGEAIDASENHQRAFEGVKSGRLQSLKTVIGKLGMAESTHVISVDLQTSSGRDIYHMVIKDAVGHIRDVRVDAHTAEVVN